MWKDEKASLVTLAGCLQEMVSGGLGVGDTEGIGKPKPESFFPWEGVVQEGGEVMAAVEGEWLLH